MSKRRTNVAGRIQDKGRLCRRAAPDEHFRADKRGACRVSWRRGHRGKHVTGFSRRPAKRSSRRLEIGRLLFELRQRGLGRLPLDSYLRDHRQNESNIVIEAPGRSSCSQEIDDALDGGVGAVIGGFEPAVWTVLRVGPVMEAAVGEGAAQARVEEEEEEGDLDALG